MTVVSCSRDWTVEFAAAPVINHITIGGIRTARLNRRQLTQLMVHDCKLSDETQPKLPRLVFSSNGFVIAEFHRQRAFRDLLLGGDIIDADGMPLVMASRIFCKNPLEERVATTDFIGDAAQAAVKNGLKFYFLGGKPDVARLAAENLQRLYPGLQVVGYRDGYFRKDEEAAVCDEIRRVGTDVLWVGLGSPLQEAFAVNNKLRLQGVSWIRTCGGLFDHCTGATKRAPVLVQNIGFEWLWRLAQEPRRLAWRYIVSNPQAIMHLATKTYD